jgi:replicative DNA helicase
MNAENIFHKALGIALNLSFNEQQEYINLLEKDWFESYFTKSLYEGISSLSNQGNYVDLLNITEWLRENNYLEKDTLVKLTTLTTNIDFSETLNKEGVLNSCWYHYSVKKVFLMLQNVNNEMQNISPRSSYILEEVSKVKELLSINTTIKEITNIDSINEILHKHNQAKLGIPIGLELGWKCLKERIILEPDDVMIVGGRPAMGKTAWAISLIQNLCLQENKVVVFFSLEMAHDRIVRRIIANITGIDSNHIKYGHCSDSEIAKIEELKNNPFWDNLIIFDGSHTTKDIETKLQTVKNKKEINLWVVDYLQKVLPNKSESRYYEVTKISNDVKRIVMAHRIPCIALAQLSRDVGRTGKRPSLPDLKESGEIEQDASIVGFLHRPEYYGEMLDENGNDMQGIGEFITAKNRDGSIGINQMTVKLETSEWLDKLEQPTQQIDVIDYQAGFPNRNNETEIPF